ncbi:MAG: serine protease [Verrucomicrobiota bacterium]
MKVEGHFRAIPILSSRDIKVGASVFTLGFPNPQVQGITPKFTSGEISAISGIQDDPRHFQISVPIQPGNSGGPLIDNYGNVIGIITSRLSDSYSVNTSGAIPQNVNYALKSSFLSAFLEAQREVSAGLLNSRLNNPEKIEELVKDAEQSVELVIIY